MWSAISSGQEYEFQSTIFQPVGGMDMISKAFQREIGRQITFALADREIVGVVGDVRFRGLERTSEPQIYLSSQQVDDSAITFYSPKALAIRTIGDPSKLVQYNATTPSGDTTR